MPEPKMPATIPSCHASNDIGLYRVWLRPHVEQDAGWDHQTGRIELEHGFGRYDRRDDHAEVLQRAQSRLLSLLSVLGWINDLVPLPRLWRGRQRLLPGHRPLFSGAAPAGADDLVLAGTGCPLSRL
jgi:hypothetical protein